MVEPAVVVTEIDAGITVTKSGAIIPVNSETKATGIVTLTGTTLTKEIALNKKYRIDKISMYFNTTNVKTYNVRMFGNPSDTAFYEELDSSSANANQSIIWYPNNLEAFKYNRPVKLQFNFSSYTLNDTVSIMVQLTRL